MNKLQIPNHKQITISNIRTKPILFVRCFLFIVCNLYFVICVLALPNAYAQPLKNFNDLGLDDLKQGNLTRAIAEFTKAIEADHTNAAGYTNRALAYDKLGDLTNAISDSTQAIEINPKDFKAYANRGQFYTKQGNIMAALSDYNEAIKINPKFAAAYNNKAPSKLYKRISPMPLPIIPGPLNWALKKRGGMIIAE